MPNSTIRKARRGALAVAALTALAAPAAVAAKPAVVDLHVEDGGKALVPGFSYQTGASSFKTDKRKPACNGSGDTKRLGSPTALGTLAGAADTRSSLRPVGISDQFDFGLLVCAVGPSRASDSAFWLYKVNHKAPQVGGDQKKVHSGDQVLWYFSNPAAKSNTGAELGILAPTRAASGKAFKATVVAYADNGARKPAAGAKVALQGRTATTDSKGQISVKLEGNGLAKLRASRGSDVSSPVTTVCFAKKLSGCSARLGKTIYGSAGNDRMHGTAGPDAIRSGPGRDRIDVRGGGEDVVRCGKGRDRATLGKGDRAAADCEIVSRPKKR